MNRYEGSNAVQNARFAVIITGTLAMAIGVVMAFIGFASGYDVDWNIVVPGILFIGIGIGQFILNAVLKGFEQVVNASETYMEEVRKSKEE